MSGFPSTPSAGWGFPDATLGDVVLLETTLFSFGVSSSSRSCFSPSGFAVAYGTIVFFALGEDVATDLTGLRLVTSVASGSAGLSSVFSITACPIASFCIALTP